jgi:hypothetical protein
MATAMTDDQRRGFLSAGTRTAIVSTVRPDGRPHAAPVWFTLDGDDVLLQSGADTVTGGNLAHDAWAKQVGRRNAVPGEYLVRVTPTHITALAGLAD